MKVVKILAIVFGVLLLLTGGGLLVGASLAGTGQSALDRQLTDSGLAGPVQGQVTAIDQGSLVTVDYTDKAGESHTGRGPATSQPQPKVGDTVTLYYSTDDPEQIVVYDLPGGSLTAIGGSLRTAGIICLIVGGLLLIGGIVGLVVGKKKPTAALTAGGGYPGAPANPPPPGYPAQSYGNQQPPPPPPPGYPNQPYQGQPPATYSGPQYGNQPPPPGYPGQQGQYPPPQNQQPPSGYPNPGYGNQPPPPGYSSQPYQNQPPSYPPQEPPKAPPSAG